MPCVIFMLICMVLCDCDVYTRQKNLITEIYNMMNEISIIIPFHTTKLVNMNIFGLKTHFWAQNAKNTKLKGPKRQYMNSEG
mgnify:CR=1 FL=1